MERYAVKRALDLQRSAGIHNHPVHDKLLCDYADAAAKEVYTTIQEELPRIVSNAVDHYLSTQKARICVDEASVRTVKSKISDLLSSLFR